MQSLRLILFSFCCNLGVTTLYKLFVYFCFASSFIILLKSYVQFYSTIKFIILRILIKSSINQMKSRENLYSAWAILIGVILAIIIGIFQIALVSYYSWIYFVLAFLGIIVGLASVNDDYRDAIIFLMATVSVVIVSSIGQERLLFIGDVGRFMVTILNALLTMFIPATIIVALKTVFSVTSVK